MVEEGLVLGDIARLQQREIEEIYLHLFEMKDRMEEKKEENEKLREQNELLRKQLEAMKGQNELLKVKGQ